MIINKNSWHYKLISNVYDSQVYDLCTYFRRLVIILTVAPAIAMVLLATVSIIGTVFLMLAGYFPVTVNPFGSVETVLLGLASGIAFISFLITIVFLIGDMIVTTIDASQNRRSSPGILSTYLESKSNKFCSHIEYKD